MPADLHASRYLIDGVDLAATGVRLTHEGAGLWDGLSEDISAVTYPGISGGDIVGGVYRPYTRSIMYLVQGLNFDDVWSKIVALRRRCKPGRTVTLTREMPDPEGTAANTDHTTTGRRQTDRPDWISDNAAVLDIDWLITGGAWLAASVTAAVSGTVTALGDTPTQAMTVTLAAGAARTVTNTTNGFWFTFGYNPLTGVTIAVPTGGILVDVVKRKATAITGGADYSAYLTWGKEAPMQLEPGANAMTVSAGTASISYQPAYL